MLVAEEYIGSVGVGVTGPQFFRANDGAVYVVKLQNNQLGRKVLVSEFLAAKLGEFMGLCFPASAVIEINHNTLLQNDKCRVIGGSFGRHFASRYLENAEYLGKNNLYKAVNTNEMAGVILFDHMFHNADRTNNRRNLLLRQEKDGHKIYAIDNSHLFRSGRWTCESLTSLGAIIKIYYRYSFGLLLRERLMPQDFIPYLEKLENLNQDDLVNIVKEIPVEWLPDESERQALVQYMVIRQSMARIIWEKLCNQIPREHGGRRCLQGKIIRLMG